MTTLVHGEVARGARILLRQKRLDDAPDDYRWRTQSELSRYDAARPLRMSYEEYLLLYSEELSQPSPHRRSLAIEDQFGHHIGNVMYYNIDAKCQEAELGITIGERAYWGRGYGTEAVQILLEHLLGVQGFRRIHLKTLTWNRRAQRCFEKVGFALCGRVSRGGNSFDLMEFRREWLADRQETSQANSLRR